MMPQISRGGGGGSLSSATPQAIGTAAAGSAVGGSHADHVHAGDHTALASIGTNTHAQIDTHIATTAAHGATGAVVGTTGAQTLYSKTLDNPTVTTLLTVTSAKVRLDDGFILGWGGTHNGVVGSNAAGTVSLWANNAERVKVDASGNLIITTDGGNIEFGTSTGTMIGSTASQKFAFWGKSPIVQPTTAIVGAAFVAGSGTAVNDASTFGGYTLKQLAAIIINMGLAA